MFIILPADKSCWRAKEYREFFKNMKTLLKFAAIVFIIFTALFIFACFFISTNGKKIVTERLSAALQKPVSLGDVSVSYPLGLKISGLNIEGYGYVKEVLIGFGVYHFLNKNLTFSSLVLIEPQLVVHRSRDSKIILGHYEEAVPPVVGEVSGAVTGEAAGPLPVPVLPVQNEAAKKPAAPVAFAADRLMIKGGAVNFFDHSTGEGPFQVIINGIDLRAQKVSFSAQKPARTKFELSANIAEPDLKSSGGTIESSGWMNFAKKDMKSDLKITGLDARLFSPYYSKSAGKDFKKFVADLSADLESKDNEMTVKGKLEVKDMAFEAKTGEDAKSASIESLIFQGLQSVAKEIAIEFHFKTKMDSFKLESISFSGNIFSRLFDGSPKEFQLAGF